MAGLLTWLLLGVGLLYRPERGLRVAGLVLVIVAGLLLSLLAALVVVLGALSG